MTSRFAALDPADYALPERLRSRLLSPALVIYLDRVRENVRRILEHTGGVERWRPHVKTTKLPPVFRELARAGVRNFKCATLREAEVLLTALEAEGTSTADVLCAYPLVGPALAALGEVAERHPGARLSVLCEDPDRVPDIPGELGVFVDVNPGMNRTGLPVSEKEAVLAVARAAGERFRGVHYYDGHLHGDHAARRAAVFACYDELFGLLAHLADGDRAVGEVITSGTPSFLHALAWPRWAELTDTLHRVSPGTVVFHDLRSEEENPDLDLEPAALLFTRVISHPTGGHFTLDAGSKSIAAEAGDPCAFVLGHPGAVALAPSEEHLPVRSANRPERGAELLLVPRHICPTVNLAEEVVLMDGDLFLGTAKVEARAHPLFGTERRTTGG